jgi:hypothetical protein
VLAAQFGQRIPAGVQEDEQRFDTVASCDGDKLREAPLETTLILQPQQVVEEDPHRVESVQLCPAEFDVDALGAECVGLKHLQLVAGLRGDVVGADQPALRFIPAIGTVNRPGSTAEARGARASAAVAANTSQSVLCPA